MLFAVFHHVVFASTLSVLPHFILAIFFLTRLDVIILPKFSQSKLDARLIFMHALILLLALLFFFRFPKDVIFQLTPVLFCTYILLVSFAPLLLLPFSTVFFLHHVSYALLILSNVNELQPCAFLLSLFIIGLSFRLLIGFIPF